MKRVFLLSVLVGLAFFHASTASAQDAEIGRDSNVSTADSIQLSAGWRNGWVVGLGYSRHLGTVAQGPTVFWESSVELPVVLGLAAGAISTGLSGLVVTQRGVGVMAGVSTSFDWLRDVLGSKVGWGGAFLLRPGYHSARWTLAPEVEQEVVFVTRLAHSEAVDELFEDRAQPGLEGESEADPASERKPRWVGFASRAFKLGGFVRWRAPGSILGAFARGGWYYAPRMAGLPGNPPLGPLPFYLAAGGEARW